MMFSIEQKKVLLCLAREALETVVIHHRVITPSIEDEALRQPLGAFVTLTKNGELRGCIGYIEAVYPLYETVVRCAISAALHDHRFYPVTAAELKAIRIDISVLSPLSPIQAEDVKVGVHGLVVEQGNARGLLLPQVPVEWGWNRNEFLEHTCSKAGLPCDAWRCGAQLSGFTAEVFSENEIPGSCATGAK